MAEALRCPTCDSTDFRITEDDTVVQCADCDAKCYLVLLGDKDEQPV